MSGSFFSLPSKEMLHPEVLKGISAISLYDRRIVFSRNASTHRPLTFKDYQDFLLLVQEKLKGLDTILDELHLGSDDNAALEGLIASWSKTQTIFPIKTLTLELNTHTPNTLLQLKELLVTISLQPVEQISLELSAEAFSEQDIQELVELVQNTPDIAIAIVLNEPYKSCQVQRILDTILSDRVRNRKIQTATQAIADKKKTQSAWKNRVIRKRARLSEDVEVYIDQEQQAEVAVEIQVQRSEETSVQFESSQRIFYTLERYQKEWKTFNYSNNGVDPELDWCNWIGAFHALDANEESRFQLSKSACEELLHYYDAFKSGIDLKNLPPGFTLEEIYGIPSIDFSEQMKRALLSDRASIPLTVHTKDVPLVPPLTHLQTEHCIALTNIVPEALQQEWEQLQTSAVYNRAEDEQFRQNLAQNLLSSKENALIALLNSEEKKLLNKIVAENPTIKISNVLPLYLQYGQAGLAKLESLTNTPVFNSLQESCFITNPDYMVIMDPGFDQACALINGFFQDDNERLWWMNLLKEHCANQSAVNVVNLANDFVTFKTQLKALKPGNYPFPPLTPESCKTSKNMTVTLSRILQLMKHCKEENREAQWALIGALDFSSTGFIKAISHSGTKKWAFVTPQMQLTKQRETGVDAAATHYSAPLEWSAVHVKQAGYNVSYLIDDAFSWGRLILSSGPAPSSYREGGSSCTIQIDSRGIWEPVGKLYLHPSDPLSIIFDSGVMQEDMAEFFEHNPQGSFFSRNKLKNTGQKLHFLYDLGLMSENITKKYHERSGFNLYVTNTLSDTKDRAYRISYVYLQDKEELYFIKVDGTAELVPLKNKAKFKAAIQSHVKPKDSSDIQSWFIKVAEEESLITKDTQGYTQAFSLDETVHNFFRFAAYQDQRGGMPLHVYQYVHQEIQNQSHFSVAEQCFMYGLMAGMLADARETLKEPDDAIPYIKEILEFNVSTLLQTKSHILSYFELVEDIPPLYFFFQVVQMISVVAIGEQKTLMQLLSRALLFSGMSFYKGLKDYSLDDLKRDNLVINHLRTVDIIESKAEFSWEGLPKYKRRGRSDSIHLILIELISSFNLIISPKEVDKDKVIQKLKAIPGLVLLKALRLLTPINVRKSGEKSLTKADFLDLLEALETLNDETQVLNALNAYVLPNGNCLSDYFPGRKIEEKYIDYQIPPEVQDKITHYFTSDESKRIIESMLLRYDNSEHYDYVVDKLIAIYKTMTPEDFDSFIRTLGSSPGLFPTNEGLDAQNSPLTQLLRQIYLSGSQNHLMCLLKAERELVKKSSQKPHEEFVLVPDFSGKEELVVNHLSGRSLLYVQTIAPVLDAMRNLSIPRAELASLVIETLLKTPLEELNDLQKPGVDEDATSTSKTKYSDELVALYKRINTLVANNAGIKQQFLGLFQQVLNAYEPKEHVSIINYLSTNVGQLERTFSLLDNKNQVVALCMHFQSDTDKELTPSGLLGLIKTIESHPADVQKQLLTIALEIINNEKGYQLSSFKRISNRVQKNPDFSKALFKIYKHAPYPKLKQLEQWHKSAKEDPDTYIKAIDSLYKKFDKKPCGRDPKNGFKPEHARKQLSKFVGLVDPNFIDVDAFYKKTQDMQARSSAELLSIMQQFNPDKVAKPNQDLDILIAAAAELLHRSKGVERTHSMELNTTQYLALLSILKTPGHVTSQIATGEGKSRIMMILCACQQALGKTVDFVTSDIELATRDFVAYQPFFNMLGMHTQMIFSNTPPTLYQHDAIHISDPNNLILFRNQAQSNGLGDLVINPDPTKRALLLDEADMTYFDAANNRFNFSSSGDEAIRDMQWVYALLMDYLSKPKVIMDDGTEAAVESLLFDDVEGSRLAFLQFAKANNISPQKLTRLNALPNAKIEEWQIMGFMAKKLIYKKQYDIVPDSLIQTDRGLIIGSEAKLILAHDLSENSKLSFGMHQCLHAELERLRNLGDQVEDHFLREALKQCHCPFVMQDEKQIIYSSTSKNLLDDYKEGILKGVTGTAGSIMEREEAHVLHGESSSPMHFIDVPREKGLSRRDRAIRLTRNKTQHLKALIEEIRWAQAKNQPILVIAKGARESAHLFGVLSQHFPEEVQHLHHKLSIKERNACIEKVGEPSVITVSTGMSGRGRDYRLKEKAKTHGLLVIGVHLPRVRDEWQWRGRSGRYGEAGEFLFILDKSELKKELKKRSLKEGGYYTNPEAYIEREQKILDRRAQFERIIKQSNGDFRLLITKGFYKWILNTSLKREQWLPYWSQFSAKTDQIWNEIWPVIQLNATKILTDSSDVETYLNTIDELLNTYKKRIDEEWMTLGALIKTNNKQPGLPNFTLGIEERRLLKSPMAPTSERVRYFDHYDVSHDGRAVQYTHWSIPVIASLKGWANLFGANYPNVRRPFANTRAWWEGHGQLFADFAASKHKGILSSFIVMNVLSLAAGAALLAIGTLFPLGIGLLVLGAIMTTSIALGAPGRIVNHLLRSPVSDSEHLDKGFELKTLRKKQPLPVICEPGSNVDTKAFFEKKKTKLDENPTSTPTMTNKIN